MEGNENGELEQVMKLNVIVTGIDPINKKTNEVTEYVYMLLRGAGHGAPTLKIQKKSFKNLPEGLQKDDEMELEVSGTAREDKNADIIYFPQATVYAYSPKLFEKNKKEFVNEFLESKEQFYDNSLQGDEDILHERRKIKELIDSKRKNTELQCKFLRIEYDINDSSLIMRYNEKFSIYQDYIAFNGEKIGYNNILNIFLSDGEFIVNLISILPKFDLYIEYLDDFGEEKYFVISAHSPIIKTPKFYKLKKAHQILKYKMNYHRIIRFLTRINLDGYAHLSDEITISKEGLIRSRDKIADISLASQNGIIDMVDLTKRSFISGNKTTSRDWIVVSENKIIDEEIIYFQKGLYDTFSTLEILQNFTMFMFCDFNLEMCRDFIVGI